LKLRRCSEFRFWIAKISLNSLYLKLKL